MRNMLRLGTVLTASFLYAACAAAQTDEVQSLDTSTCRNVSGQAEIDGVMQPIAGLACLQPDGTWVLVNNYSDTWVAPVGGYPYYYGPWYWGAPFVLGTSFVFVDHFHHFHRFHHGPHPSAFPMHPVHPGGGMHSWGGGHAWGGGHVWGGGHGSGGGMHR
jgi:surface antigen